MRLLRSWVSLRDAIPTCSGNRCRLPRRAGGHPATYPRFDYLMGKFEIVRNPYFSVNVYESYDSDPPVEDVARNDFSVSSSLGWTF